MQRPAVLHDSRLASLCNQLTSGDDGSGPRRMLAAGGFGLSLLSAVGSIIAHGVLPDRVRIHWTLGMGPYYGPEFAPAWLVLLLFPVLIAGTAVLASVIDARMRNTDAFTEIRPFYIVAVLGTLTVLLGCQSGLILANLYA